jgi:hypothetical protein
VFAALLEQGAWRQRLDHAAGRSVSAQDIQPRTSINSRHGILTKRPDTAYKTLSSIDI